MREGDTPEIVNRFRENTYSGRVAFDLSYMLSQNMLFTLAGGEQRNIYSAQYSGNTDSHQWQHYGETLMLLIWWYRMNDHFTMSFRPQFTLFDRNTDHRYKTTEFLPGAKLSFNYNINRKNNLSFHLDYYINSPQANVTNDVIIRESELTWIKGNPNIKTNDVFTFYLLYTSSPIRDINMSFSATWEYDRNEQMLRYFSGGKEYDGIIRQYSNAGNRGKFSCMYDIGAWLIRNKLRLSGTIYYDYNYYTDGLHKSHGYFRPRGSISWLFGNCQLLFFYDGKTKTLANGGTQTFSSPDNMFLSFYYGNGNFNLGVRFNYPFGKHKVYESWLSDNCYSLSRSNWNIGRSVTISLTYTFDYGKRITPGIEISEENIINSSKL